jgi:S1-C subfamily serine protease
MSLLFVGVVIIALLVMPSNIANPYRKIDFETVTKSVVMVIPRQKEYSEGGSMGTGFLIGDNLFMTNAHVVNSILQKTPLKQSIAFAWLGQSNILPRETKLL